MMKNCVILVFVFFAGVIADVHAENRRFTNKEGKVIEGSVVSVSGTHTVIERATDRKVFTIPLASLSGADNEFLDHWREGNAEFKLAFEVVKQTDKPSTPEKPEHAGILSKQSSGESFRIKITNLGNATTPPAQILFHHQMEVNGKARRPPPVRRTNPQTPQKPQKPTKSSLKKPEPDESAAKYEELEGLIDLPGIEAGKTVEVATPSVVLVESKSVSFSAPDPVSGLGTRGSSTKKETLEGISFVVKHRDREVAAWTTPGTDARLVLFRAWLRSAEMRKLEPARCK